MLVDAPRQHAAATCRPSSRRRQPGDATKCRHLQDVRSSFSVLRDRKLNWFLNWFALPFGAIYHFRSTAPHYGEVGVAS
jgi:hypothetical protein